MDENRKKLAKKYEKIKLTVGITEAVISFVLLALFVWLGYSKKLETYAYSFTQNPYAALLIFGLCIGVAASILSLPVDYTFGYRLEHKFRLSNQTLARWIGEKLKSAAVGSALLLPIAFLFFYLIRNYQLWWLYLAVIVWIYSAALARIAPIVIFPIFYKFKPIENESLKNTIMNLCEKAGFKVKGVFTFDMSKNTKKANAAFTGMGKSRRIIISDTLISGFSEEEIETVFAHELGHYKKGHIRKGILFSAFGDLAGLFVISALYNFLYPKLGFGYAAEIGALPLLSVIVTIWTVLAMPLGSSISRKFEFEADRYSVETTGNFPAFESTMEKLSFQNLANPEPNKFVEFWSYSHPSIKRRIEAAKEYTVSLH